MLLAHPIMPTSEYWEYYSEYSSTLLSYFLLLFYVRLVLHMVPLFDKPV